MAGNGANMALRDGLELAEQLMASQNADLTAAIASYDEASAPRVHAAIMGGRRNIAVAHSTGLQQVKITLAMLVAGLIMRFKAWWHGGQHAQSDAGVLS